MIHFDFIVDDREAETVMHLIHDEISVCNMEIMDCMSEGNREADILYYRNRIKYIENLLEKMSNSRVE
jgi:hypothetical protein